MDNFIFGLFYAGMRPNYAYAFKKNIREHPTEHILVE